MRSPGVLWMGIQTARKNSNRDRLNLMRKLCSLIFLFALASPSFGQKVLPTSATGKVTASIDTSGWRNFKVPLTQNITFQFIGIPTPEQSSVTVIFVQNNVGGFTVTFSSAPDPQTGILISIANPCAVTSTANATTICQFEFDNATNTWTGFGGSGGGTPGGSNTQVQYNNNGAFGGAASATINPAGNYLTVSINNAGAAALQLTNAAGGNTRVLNAGANVFVTNQGDLANLNTLATLNNCSSSASPAVCGAAPAGSVVIAAAATTVQVNTTAVTANSQILVFRDDSLGTKLSVTCNTATVIGEIKVSARTAATNFTITVQT